MKEATLSLSMTTILGVAFLATQYEGFLDLVENGIYFTGVESNASGSFFNVLDLGTCGTRNKRGFSINFYNNQSLC